MKEEEITKLADRLVHRGAVLHQLYQDLEEMYFMDAGSRPATVLPRPGQDEKDIKLTLSPSARNAIIGLVRLLTTNEPRFIAKSESGAPNLSKIEDLAKRMWTESCQQQSAEIHVDLVRSGALYGDVHLGVDYLEDLINTADDYEAKRLKRIEQRTPALFSVRRPPEDYVYWGSHGVRGLLRKWKATGDDVNATFKPETELSESQEVIVCDWLDTTHRKVWVENGGDVLMPWKEHGLNELMFASQIADGSDLWLQEDQRRQPFLYAMSRGNIWRRENQWLTELFTSMNERGTGLLVGFDQEPGNVTVEFAGPGLRYVRAPGPRMLSDAAFDPEMLTVKNQVLQPLVEASTIFPQTLGSPQEMGRAPFSSLAMLAQSGQLPTVPIKRAVSQVIANLMMALFRRLKEDPPESGLPGDLTPADIPDDLEIEVTLEIKLPQDMFKNIQGGVLALDKGLASLEWVQSTLLQVDDPDAMMKHIWKEHAAEMAFKAMLEQYVQTNLVPPAPTSPTSPAGEMPAGGAQVTPGGGAIEASQPQAPAGANMPPAMPEEMPA